MNICALSGRLTKDPEIRYFESGTTLCRLAIAVNRKKNEQPIYFNEVNIWGNNAENCANYLRKGDAIALNGRIKVESWNDKLSGEKRQKVVVEVKNIDFFHK